MKVKGEACPRCGMPDAGGDVLELMNLHARCRANKCLPHSGGMLDQPAYLMELFDVIDQVKVAFAGKERERAEADALRGQMASRLARA